MRISELDVALAGLETLVLLQPDGNPVPAHFHITEVGLKTKNFIDCGGTIRQEKRIAMQVWLAHDYDHRLTPSKLQGILKQFREVITAEDLEIEIEFQQGTIGIYHLSFDGRYFTMGVTQTACLASDQCGIDFTKPKMALADLGKSAACCPPQSGCC